MPVRTMAVNPGAREREAIPWISWQYGIRCYGLPDVRSCFSGGMSVADRIEALKSSREASDESWTVAVREK